MNIKGRALKVGIATIVAQIFSALGFVAIPKFFSASDYGELVLILGIVSILQPIATMRIEILTSVVDSDNVSQFLIGFVKRLSALVSLGCFILSFLYFYLIRGNVWQESLRIGLFISCITLFQSLSIILVQINLRNQRIRPIAFSGVMQNSSTLILQILFGLFKFGSTFLITAYLLGRIIGIIPLNVRRNNMKKEEILRQDKYLTNLKPFLKPTSYLFSSGVMDAAILYLPVLLIIREYGYGLGGNIGYLQNILLVPVSLTISMLTASLFSNSKKLNLITFQNARELLWRELLPAYKYFVALFIFSCSIILPWFFRTFLVSEWQINSKFIILFVVNFSLSLILIPETILMVTMHKFALVWKSSILKFVSASSICVLTLKFSISLDQFLFLYYGNQIICSIILFCAYRRAK